ncbi:BTB domain-containing protein [Favolaschia claudopus]|uniref:BTB domain-containing protein n=1 Tax=Favolaschia claudopus TaxID=2862362 RepID=A0AAW0BFM7_9AGAR
MSSTDPPPAKRQRTDDTQTTRSELWNEDGNIVLQAANTQFRVHWSVLARSSSVFSDMQGLPQPAEQPLVDGCPILEISDDPDDVEYLLKALYIPSFHCQTLLPFPVVRALIRLGRKYDFEYLYDSALARLRKEFPATLEEYDACEKSTTIEDDGWLTHDVISLARENEILSVLPAAYHFLLSFETLASLKFTEIFEEGHVALSILDLGKCIIGREKLFQTQFQPGYTLGWLRKRDFKDCTSLKPCRKSREAVLASFVDAHLQDGLVTPESIFARGFLFCSGCRQHIRESTETGRKRMWQALPIFFDLPAWDELSKER